MGPYVTGVNLDGVLISLESPPQEWEVWCSIPRSGHEKWNLMLPCLVLSIKRQDQENMIRQHESV